MGHPPRPHLLGIDDGPFEKHGSERAPIVGVVMEGQDLVEGVAITSFPVDGDGVTGFLAGWVGGLRFRPALQGIVLGGITIAGLAVVDVEALAREVGVPVLVANRRDPTENRLAQALRAAGLHERVELVRRTPEAFALGDGLHLSFAGTDRATAELLARAARGKSRLPEPLRLAHLIARAIATGESRGRP